MTTLRIHGLSKRFAGKPPTVAIDDLSLEIQDGEFVVLLGPSGCGKTTTLRCLAGLETPDTGRISFGDQDVFDSSTRLNLSPDGRSIGMVFQSYALWPHMTVRKNIAYPIKARKRQDAHGWVEEMAELVDCVDLLDRYPAELSGGQQQRVALARGLVARPGVIFFDEPLSNLDARLRDAVRAHIHELHGRLGFSAVYVTHDQEEALALADRLVIMRKGRVEQVGTPEEVFEQPVSEYVADFIGMANRLPLERQGTGLVVGDSRVDGNVWFDDEQGGVVARLRADDALIAPTPADLPSGLISCTATVIDSQFGGRHMDVWIRIGEERVHVRVSASSYRGWARSLDPGQSVVFAFSAADARYFGQDGLRLVEGTGVRYDERDVLA